MSAPTKTIEVTRVRGGVGENAARPDGIPKVTGEFAYSSDLWAEGMLWGATVRSPHPRARIVSIDIAKALALPGVWAVLTHDDVPGNKTYGLEIPDQPVLAWDQTRYQGEPVVLIAADHPETATRAADLVDIFYEELDPITDPEVAMDPGTDVLHPEAKNPHNLIRHVRIRSGDPDASADVVVSGEYTIGMQDQAFLGPESGLAVPDGEGGVDLYVATQWLHVDLDQLAGALGLTEDRVRITLAGVGGAFGAREDLSMQIHCCMLALHTNRPVKMMYSREESFFGHVHRHPARMYYEHGATRDGDLVYVKARIILDGGAYASSSTAVISNATCFAVGPYEVPNATLDGYVVYTDNPPCGAMRGFGSVQACFGHESQMDKLADALGMDPLELRIRNAMTTGSKLPTGQIVQGPAPVKELLESVRDMPHPDPTPSGPLDLTLLPGGVSNTTHGEGVRRGVGYGVGFKNIAYSEGFDDYSTARVKLWSAGGEPIVEVHTAAAEVGQGVTTIQMQIARTELGVEQVVVLPADTQVRSAGSTSASRQTWMTGGAVRKACEAIRVRVLTDALVGLDGDPGDLSLEGGKVISSSLGVVADLADAIGDAAYEETYEYHHKKTFPLDPETGQGDAHVAFAFSAHRATCDVDTELGLVKVVELATAQDVGKAINPQAVEGQIEGGTAQGLGLAVMEEIQVKDGKVMNPSFTDYLIPTILDMPPMQIDVMELGDPDSEYGVKGVGEPPTISSTPAILAALRNASEKPLTHIPVRPDHFLWSGERPGELGP
ncbi:MAG: xanthine dehydrogenase subunit D [Actinobacteria bacterium]|nr:xanthine dehydrogenase subunit D [Actinomycetota bacterium]